MQAQLIGHDGEPTYRCRYRIPDTDESLLEPSECGKVTYMITCVNEPVRSEVSGLIHEWIQEATPGVARLKKGEIGVTLKRSGVCAAADVQRFVLSNPNLKYPRFLNK
jgi:hypothetical protein